MNILPSFFVNISAAYFMLAAVGLGDVKITINDFILRLSLNIFFATIYFIIAVKSEKII